ncbi:RNA polymerase sigma factor, sigma-70 family [Synechococcus sp. PCC 7502]|uniref:sigma-70 family RNA polymerase sigma factor n=1 Tax=Synechococcus sp. PCC 7502 TaxID=1173263 RepID=UPI00029FCCE7|nr:sigma-70 family RNA polymerase sigma factor [Synechococcus sp. PCC 7502]AFY74027.1 RNA polymerase sigma factor, sigma-70 family [Synechococcus sp. PCC 7502]
MVSVVSSKIALENQPESDNYLVRLCLQGHTHIFSQLYQRHQQKVRSTLYQLCGNDGLDDLVQEVFIRAWKGLAKFRQTAQFSTWLYRITWNVACDRRRSYAVSRSRNVEVEDLNQLADIHLSLVDKTSELSNMHYRDLVQKGLASLSLEHRTVVVMHDLEELSQKEIAEIINIPIGTVKSRLFHARGALRKFLESQGVEV